MAVNDAGTGGGAGNGANALHWRSVLEGAGLALAVTLPPVILVRILHGDDMDGRESNLWIVTVLAIFAGFALGGHRAAKGRTNNAMAQAAAAAGLAFAALSAYSLIRHMVTGDEITPAFMVRLVLVGTITVSVAMLGGLVALRRARR